MAAQERASEEFTVAALREMADGLQWHAFELNTGEGARAAYLLSEVKTLLRLRVGEGEGAMDGRVVE